MKAETGRAITPNMARFIHVVAFLLACALPTWVFFQIDGETAGAYLCRLVMLVMLGWMTKGLVDGLRRVDEVEITSIVQCLPWRLSGAKRRQR